MYSLINVYVVLQNDLYIKNKKYVHRQTKICTPLNKCIHMFLKTDDVDELARCDL